jgi:hypothetical protein
MKLLITIDTECDNAWGKSTVITTENAKYLLRFQQLCEKFDYKPTYLVSYEMAQDSFFQTFALDVLRRKACEVGSHPHPWNSPPDYKLTVNDMMIHPFLIEYPREIVKSKVSYLTKLLEDIFGMKVNSHRAGRWAFNESYAQVLFELGYKVDCSVTPLIKLDAGKRPRECPQAPIIDYTEFPNKAYFLDLKDISRPGQESLLEIPMTTIAHYGRILYKMYNLLPSQILQRVFKITFGRPIYWFRPHSIYYEMLNVAKRKLCEKSDYIMFMLHSSEFMPGGSPIFKTKNDIDHLYATIEEAFDFLKANGIKGLTCKEYYDDFSKRGTESE